MSRVALSFVLVAVAVSAVRAGPRDIAVPRPDLPFGALISSSGDPADVPEYLTWPLPANRHPSLEPSYAIAPVFAKPGVTWLDLCRNGAQNRTLVTARVEHVAYLRAWCEAAAANPAAALTRLGTLLHATTPRLAAAARLDIASILVDAGDAATAERLLARAGIHELAVLDLTAAAYADIGRTADATALTDLALTAFSVQEPADRCRRLARRLVLAPAHERPARVQDFDDARDKPCVAIRHELTCWSGGSCAEYYADHGIPALAHDLVEVYVHWPTTAVSSHRWEWIADALLMQLGDPGGVLLMTDALEAYVRATGCDEFDADKVRRYVHWVRVEDHDAAIDPRLAVLETAPKTLCTATP